MDSRARGTKNGGTQKGKPPPAYVPLYTRIKRLRRSAQWSIWFWRYVPFAILLVATLALVISGSFFSIFLVIPLFIGAWVAQDAVEMVYHVTSSYMYQTNLPLLVSDEQVLQQFHIKPTTGLASFRLYTIQPKNTIQQLIFSSTHNSLLREYLTGGATPSSKKRLDGNCLWLSGTVAGQSILGILPGLAVLSACNNGCLGCFFLPVWMYHNYTFLCRQASLMAVCDYFLGTPQVEMHNLNNVGRYFVASAATEGKPAEVGLLPPDAA